MLFHIDKIKYIKPRGMKLVSLLVKYKENNDIIVSYDYLHNYYNINRVSYNGYQRITSALILPHVYDLKKYLGLSITYYKYSNDQMCFKYKFK